MRSTLIFVNTALTIIGAFLLILLVGLSGMLQRPYRLSDYVEFGLFLFMELVFIVGCVASWEAKRDPDSRVWGLLMWVPLSLIGLGLLWEILSLFVQTLI